MANHSQKAAAADANLREPMYLDGIAANIHNLRFLAVI